MSNPVSSFADAATRADKRDASALESVFKLSSREDAEALVFPDGRLSFAELDRLTNKMAAGLLGLGMLPGDKVAIFMQENLSYVALLVAVAKLGMTAVPINIRSKVAELRYCLQRSDSKVVFTSSDGYKDYSAIVAEAIRDDCPISEIRAVCLSGVAPSGFMSRLEFESGAVSQDRASDSFWIGVGPDTPAVMLFTSGTTASPKAVPITHGYLTSVVRTIGKEYWDVGPGDVAWIPLPLCHSAGIFLMFLCLSNNITVCFSGPSEPEEGLRLMAEEHCTLAFPAFDTIWLRVVRHTRLHEYNLDSLRLINVGGLYESLLLCQRALPHAAIVQVYGLTECMVLSAGRPNEPEDERLRTCGTVRPPMEVRIAETGELQVCGPAMFTGYYGDEDATSKAFTEDGWLCTGDLMSVDDGGHLLFHGRMKDIIRMGGENIAAAELEGIAMVCPKVAMAQAVAAPDATYGEVVALFIQLLPNLSMSEDEVKGLYQGKVASFKVPRHIRFVTEWPMSGTKIMKRTLRDMIAKELRTI